MNFDSTLVQAIIGFAALLGGLYGVVTVPLLKRMDDIRADLKDFKTEVRADLAAIRAELKIHGERLARLEERVPLLHH